MRHHRHVYVERPGATVDRDLGDTIRQSPVWRAEEDFLQAVPRSAWHNANRGGVQSRTDGTPVEVSDSRCVDYQMAWMAIVLPRVIALGPHVMRAECAAQGAHRQHGRVPP